MSITKIENKKKTARLIKNNISTKEFENILKPTLDEKNLFDRYMEIKGKTYYINLANKIIKKYQLTDYEDINFTSLNSIFKYDKKLRKILFQFIAALEEKIRAYFLNNYANEKWRLLQLKTLEKKVKKSEDNFLIALENSILDEEIAYCMSLPPESLKLLFNKDVIDENFEVNLKAIRNLRNIVFHSHLLFLHPRQVTKFFPLLECKTPKAKNSSLSNNIYNLYCFLDEGFKDAFKEKLFKAIDEENDRFKYYIEKYYNLGIKNW